MTIPMLQRAIEAGGETALSLLFRTEASTGKAFEDRLPFDPAVDTLVCDFELLHGRADFLILHADGSISVVVVKDAARGHAHVTAGLGLAALCAAQLALVHPNEEVRKALLWASSGNLLLDVLIENACAAVDVIPLPWAAVSLHLAETEKVLNRGLAGNAHPTDLHVDAKGVH